MKKSDLVLTILIFAALILGVIVGQFFIWDPAVTSDVLSQKTAALQQIGELTFVQPLKMLVIPLVFVAVLVGVTSIGDPQRLGLVGGATMLYYITTMMFAITLGLILVNTIKPGAGANLADFETEARASYQTTQSAVENPDAPTGVGEVFLNLIDQMIPANPLKAAVEGQTLPTVVVAILLGLALVSVGKVGRPTIEAFEGLFQALIKIVMWILWLMPIGVFCIVAARVGTSGLDELAGPIGKYALTVVLGLLLHGFVTLPLLLWLFGRTNPYRYFWQMRKPVLTAFGTASSAATLPITIEEAHRSGGCSKRAANFVLPLGATINMDGTALYQAVAVVFLFQMMGTDLTLTQQLIILITATLSAIGAAGIPSAGLVTMAIVIYAVNNSLAAGDPNLPQLPLWTIGIILGIDRLLDMCRTAVNVWGDAIGARMITKLAPDIDDEREAAMA
ncbi:MAG: dicarboxylate/amino acid:cation symporter [Phycisphaerales bacterium]|nr:dicarboxylate/amino acid:cation symporter [bacterium]